MYVSCQHFRASRANSEKVRERLSRVGRKVKGLVTETVFTQFSCLLRMSE